MDKITVEVLFDKGQLQKTLEFIHGRPDYVAEIITDYFPAGKTIVVDINKIDSIEKQRYFLTGFLSSLIVFQEQAKTEQNAAS